MSNFLCNVNVIFFKLWYVTLWNEKANASASEIVKNKISFMNENTKLKSSLFTRKYLS